MSSSDIKSCYFVNTPYQVITAINMALFLQEKSDLYVINEFCDAVNISKRIEKIGIFNKVKVINQDLFWPRYENKYKQRLIHIINYLRAKKLVKYLLENDCYDKIYCSSKGRTAKIAYMTMKKSKNIELSYFDDGEGSYNNPGFYLVTKLDAFCRKLFFGIEENIAEKTIFLYSVELYKQLNLMPFTKILQLPSISKIDNAKKIYNRVFAYDGHDNFADNRVMFIDNYRKEAFDEINIKKLEQLLLIIKNELNDMGIIAKRHPRDKDADYSDGFNEYSVKGVPFEIICLNNNISEKILIAVTSTAVVAPKIEFNQEPFVIVLCNIIETKEHTQHNSFYKACQKLYKKDNKFFIPNNEQELFEALSKIKKIK